MGQEALRCMSKVIQPPQERMKGVVLQLPPPALLLLIHTGDSWLQSKAGDLSVQWRT